MNRFFLASDSARAYVLRNIGHLNVGTGALPVAGPEARASVGRLGLIVKTVTVVLVPVQTLGFPPRVEGELRPNGTPSHITPAGIGEPT